MLYFLDVRRNYGTKWKTVLRKDCARGTLLRGEGVSSGQVPGVRREEGHAGRQGWR